MARKIKARWNFGNSIRYNNEIFVQGDYKASIDILMPNSVNYVFKANFIMPDKTTLGVISENSEIVIPYQALRQIGEHFVEIIVSDKEQKYTIPQEISYKVIPSRECNTTVPPSIENKEIILKSLDSDINWFLTILEDGTLETVVTEKQVTYDNFYLTSEEGEKYEILIDKDGRIETREKGGE